MSVSPSEGDVACLEQWAQGRVANPHTGILWGGEKKPENPE